MNGIRLGRSELVVAPLAFGASSLGSVFRRVPDADGIRAVHAALDEGMNLIDVAPYYGQTEAERVLGLALRDIPRERYVLATKVGRYGDEDFDVSADRVRRSVDESLERLGVDEIDLIQCHDVEFVPLGRIIEETIPALRTLQDRGKVRSVGITGLPLTALRTVADAIEVDCVLSYCRYTLQDTSLASYWEWFRERDIGVINASPFSMGLLTKRGPPAWHPAPAILRDACRRASEYCDARGEDIAKLALQFCLAEPHWPTIVGSASADNVARCAQWSRTPPNPELLAAVRDILRPVQDRTWPTGLPENGDPAAQAVDRPPPTLSTTFEVPVRR